MINVFDDYWEIIIKMPKISFIVEISILLFFQEQIMESCLGS